MLPIANVQLDFIQYFASPEANRRLLKPENRPIFRHLATLAPPSLGGGLQGARGGSIARLGLDFAIALRVAACRHRPLSPSAVTTRWQRCYPVPSKRNMGTE